MISVIKDLFSNQVVSAVILTIIGAITKKYIQFHRRDFFSRSSSEQIKAVEWLRESANKQVISSQADSLIKISRIWADFFPANTSNQPI